ncbi:hypothetical protein K4K53_005649 [Colletotrichum sp. SAR 10_77]|nr:hypothetical protein K4K53_005649 [Colletotrichum sp. SAR 10_77]
MTKKGRPGQGARRRARKRAKLANESLVAAEAAPSDALTRRQRITAEHESRKQTNARLRQVEEDVKESRAALAEGKQAIETAVNDHMTKMNQWRTKSTYSSAVSQALVNANIENATKAFNAEMGRASEKEQEMRDRLEKENREMKQMMEEMAAQIRDLKEKIEK